MSRIGRYPPLPGKSVMNAELEGSPDLAACGWIRATRSRLDGNEVLLPIPAPAFAGSGGFEGTETWSGRVSIPQGREPIGVREDPWTVRHDPRRL